MPPPSSTNAGLPSCCFSSRRRVFRLTRSDGRRFLRSPSTTTAPPPPCLHCRLCPLEICGSICCSLVRWTVLHCKRCTRRQGTACTWWWWSSRCRRRSQSWARIATPRSCDRPTPPAAATDRSSSVWAATTVRARARCTWRWARRRRAKAPKQKDRRNRASPGQGWGRGRARRLRPVGAAGQSCSLTATRASPRKCGFVSAAPAFSTAWLRRRF